MHAAVITTLAALMALSTGTQAAAVKRVTGGYGYATFYDDHACTQNAGEAVSMGNAGCLANEIGRNSVYIQPGENEQSGVVGIDGSPSLVWSPGTDCDCQNDCYDALDQNAGNDYCWDLADHPAAQSFRFITQECSSNNC